MRRHVIALCGGVGGAKLAYGLAQVLSPHDLSIVVNTGDDFEHLGLNISPDLDTVIYALAGLAGPLMDRRLEGETWSFMSAARRLGVEGGFNLGDQDLATHVTRTHRLRAGLSLSEVTASQAAALGVRHAIIPMSDHPAPTTVATAAGEIPFQRYLADRHRRPTVGAVRLGAARSRASPGLEAALARTDVGAVILCPSDPRLSVDPILAVPGVRDGVARLGAPVVAVSPVVGGRDVGWAAAQSLDDLEETLSVEAVARHYAGLLNGLVIDKADGAAQEALRKLNVQCLVTDAIMLDEADRVWLARETIDFAQSLRFDAAG